jgi:hypothetical protein
MKNIFARRRRVDVTQLTLHQALDYFLKKGVGVIGVKTQDQLNDALNGHRSMIQTDQPLADEIELYLTSRGLGRGDVKQTAAMAAWSRQMVRGHSTRSWWILIWLKLESWWLNKR